MFIRPTLTLVILAVSMWTAHSLFLKITSDPIIGAKVRHGIQSGDWQEVKLAAIEEALHAHRRKRGLDGLTRFLPQIYIEEADHHHGGHIGHHIVAPSTKAEHVFEQVNHDEKFAKAFLKSFRITRNVLLRESIVHNPHGVTCADVCDPHTAKSSEGFGLLGLCTENYCSCDFHTHHHSVETCGAGWIFDPHSEKCSHPQHSSLCSDKSFSYTFPLQ